MAPLPERQPSQLVNAIAARLLQEGWARRRGKDGRPKLLGHCLFHADHGRPNADFYTDDGWYYCHACIEAFSLEEVQAKLGLETPEGQHDASPRGMLSVGSQDPTGGYHNKYGHPTATYFYRFPDGRVSHLKHRYLLADGHKTFVIQSPDGVWKKPESVWPIYGPNGLPPGMNYVLLEGEKAQELVTLAVHLHQGVPIFALTMGSAADMLNPANRRTLADYLASLKPNRVMVWPDNDKDGFKWSPPLHKQLLAAGIRTALVDVRALALPDHAGCDDFLAIEGDLDMVFQKEFQQVGGYTVDEIAKEIVVTKDGRMMMPGARSLWPIKDEPVGVAFFRITKDPVITPKIRQRLKTELQSKAVDSGVDVFYRRWHDRNHRAFAWRSIDQGFAHHISARGINTIQDPQNTALILPPGEPFFATTVDLDGTLDDLAELCDLFGATPLDVAALECWLLSSLIGMQTPVLMLRGEAGSGKTTLARALIGILEPTVPQIPFSRNNNMDQRAMIGSFSQSMAIVIDNVSSLSPETEDLLCQFVTGFSTPYRRLYEDKVENLSMQRAIAVTTTNWNIAKGDLVSRLIGLRMRRREAYKDEDQMEAKLNPLVERIRGHLFNRAMFYYQRTQVNPNGQSSLRLSSIGKIGRALGYDMERLEAHIAFNRSRIAGETDVWFNSVTDWYRSLGLAEGASKPVKLEEIKGAVEGLTDQFAPSNQKFAAFLYEAGPRFHDLGFDIERGRTATNRFWTVRCNRIIDDWGDEDDE